MKRKKTYKILYFLYAIHSSGKPLFFLPSLQGEVPQLRCKSLSKFDFLSQRGVQHLAQTDLIFFWIKSQRVNCSQKHYGISIIDWFPLFPLKDFPEKFWLNLLQRCNFFFQFNLFVFICRTLSGLTQDKSRSRLAGSQGSTRTRAPTDLEGSRKGKNIFSLFSPRPSFMVRERRAERHFQCKMQANHVLAAENQNFMGKSLEC